jgi:tetratricopeptide (TPR) repeat protein
VALRRLGEVQEALGRGVVARASYERACALGEKLAAADPKDGRLRSELARAYDQLGLMDFRAHNAAGAAAYLDKAVALWLPLAKSHPEMLRNLAIACNRVGDLHWQALRPAQALDQHQQALAVLEALPPGGDVALRLSDLRFTHGRAALAHAALLQLGAAAEQHRRALEYAERLVALDPDNLLWRRDLGFAAVQLAGVCLQLDEVAEARRLASLYLDSAERLSAADPHNVRWRREVALALLRVGETAGRAGEEAEARRRFGAALAVVEALRRQDPFSVELRIDAAVCHMRLADAAGRAERYAEAAAACGEVVALLEGLDAEGQLRDAGLRVWLAGYRPLRAALLRADLAVRDLKVALSAPAAVAAPSLEIRALSLARRGRHAEAAATVDLLCERFGEGGDSLTRARVYALCAGAVEEGELRRRYVDEAVAALREAVRLSPGGTHPLEPDLDPIRGEPAYRQLLEEMRNGTLAAKS